MSSFKNTRLYPVHNGIKYGSIISITFLFILFSIFPYATHAQDFSKTHLSGAFYPFELPPYEYENNFVLTVTFRTTPEALRALVPDPLEPNLDNIMSVSFVLRKMFKPERIMYTEAALSVPVTYQNDSGIYYPVRYMDLKDQQMSDHEIYGMSHVNADVEIDQVRDKFRGTVIRNGKPIIDFMFDPGSIIRLDTNQFNKKIYNLKEIPSVKDANMPALKQLISVDRKNVILESSRQGTARLFFDTLPLDPLSKIPIRTILGAMYYKISYTLNNGEVVYDYLKDGDLRSQVFKP